MAGRLEGIAWSTAPEAVKALLSAYAGEKLIGDALTSIHTSHTAVRAARSECACMLPCMDGRVGQALRMRSHWAF